MDFTLNIFAIVLAGGFALGWGTNNLCYGKKGCDACFIALIRGRKCSDCDGMKAPEVVGEP